MSFKHNEFNDIVEDVSASRCHHTTTILDWHLDGLMMLLLLLLVFLHIEKTNCKFYN